MTIINPLPYTIANGDPVDATPVQANLNQIVSNVNANAAAVAGNASQEFLVATTTNPAGAVPLAQAQSQFAPVSGSGVYAPASGNSSQTFAVGAASAGSVDAPQIAQTLGAGATSYGSNLAGTSRVANTNYTNNAGRPIFLIAQIEIKVDAGPYVSYVSLSVNGASVFVNNVVNPYSAPYSFYAAISAIIPPGATYSIGTDGTTLAVSTYSWYEY